MTDVVVAIDVGTATRRPTLTMLDAIAAHRAAWQAFQDAPAGANDESLAAEEVEDRALLKLLATPPADMNDVLDLVTHLDWYTTEERGNRDGICDEMDIPFAVHRSLSLALALVDRGNELAERVVRYFLGPDGDAASFDFDFFDADAEVLRMALAIATPSAKDPL